MKDGLYDFHFIALDHDHDGRIRIRGNLAEGYDDVHVVQGQVSRAGANLMASFDVAWRARPHAATLERPADYTIKMFGTGTETEFMLIGLAPLGLIVELRGRWSEALPAGADEGTMSPADDGGAASRDLRR